MSAVFLILAATAASIPTKGWTPDQVIADPDFRRIGSVCVCAGKVTVADEEARKLYQYSRDGMRSGQIGGEAIDFGKPVSVACAGGRLMIADTVAKKVIVLNFDGSLQLLIDGKPDHPFDEPYTLALDQDGQLCVLDRTANHVYKVSRDGVVLQAFGTAGAGPGQFERAEAMAIDDQGRIYVADEAHSRVVVFEPGGAWIREIGGKGKGPGKISGAIRASPSTSAATCSCSTRTKGTSRSSTRRADRR
ncbi:MAG: 6-bladed beta-propeller [Acidobacteriota bacterium]